MKTKEIKMVLFNDKTSALSVRVIDLNSQWDEGTGILVLAPQEIRIVNLQVPDDTIGYFKIWDNNVALLSYIKEEMVGLV
jgi:hypothetical protein